MRVHLKIILFIILFVVTASRARSIDRVSIITCDPGTEIYELEGHAALRLVDESRGIDVVANWGLFDFNSPGFVYRFVKGETDYMVGLIDTRYFLMEYSMQGRRVTEQVIEMDSVSRARLLELVEENLEPANRVYRYNYIKDNCATRPLQIVERALQDTLPAVERQWEPTTWRREMMRYHRNYPWYQFGIDLALGSGLDVAITPRETAFAPVRLREYLDVEQHDLVAATGEPLPPTPWYLTPLAVGVLVLVITALVIVLRNNTLLKVWTTVYYLVAALAALLLTFLIFISVHEATSPNWQYLWLNPLCLFPVAAVWIKSWHKSLYWYQILNFVSLLILCIIAAAGVQRLNVASWPFIGADMLLAINCIVTERCHKARHI